MERKKKMKPLFRCYAFLFYVFIVLLFLHFPYSFPISILLCHAKKIHLKYKIIQYLTSDSSLSDFPSSDFSSEKTRWVDIGTFILKKSEVLVGNKSSNIINEKRKFLNQVKSDRNYEYVLFRLCYENDIKEGTNEHKNGNINGNKKVQTNYEKSNEQNTEENQYQTDITNGHISGNENNNGNEYEYGYERCVQTFVYKKQIEDIENFLIHLILDSSNVPISINLKTYSSLENMPNAKLNIFLLKTPRVAESIHLNNLILDTKTRTSDKENDNKEKDKQTNKERTQSFLKKYWYAILIFCISLSISKHFTENLQQTMDEQNVEQPALNAERST